MSVSRERELESMWLRNLFSCSEFLSPGAKAEINIDGKTMEATRAAMKTPTRYTYEVAAEHVYTLLLKKDCYPRFMRSEHYRILVNNSINPGNQKKRYDVAYCRNRLAGSIRKRKVPRTARKGDDGSAIFAVGWSRAGGNKRTVWYNIRVVVSRAADRKHGLYSASPPPPQVSVHVQRKEGEEDVDCSTAAGRNHPGAGGRDCRDDSCDGNGRGGRGGTSDDHWQSE